MRIRFAACAFLLLTLLSASALAQVQGAAPSAPEVSPVPQAQPKRVRVGGNVAQANLVHQVAPEYPEIAKTAHISGTVLFHAVIGTDGLVQQLEYVSGPPLLMNPAFDAVRQWRYKPTLLNGLPVEIETTISVVYLEGGWVGSSIKDIPSTRPTAQSVAPQPVASQAPPPKPVAQQPVSPVAPQLQADIERLFDLLDMKGDIKEQRRTAAERSRTNLFSGVLPSGANRDKIVDAYIESYASLYSDDYAKNLAALYAKYLTDDDVKQIIQFYETPAGQHFRAGRRHMEAEEMQGGQSINTDVKKRVIRQLCNEYPEFQAAEKDCTQVAP